MSIPSDFFINGSQFHLIFYDPLSNSTNSRPTQAFHCFQELLTLNNFLMRSFGILDTKVFINSFHKFIHPRYYRFDILNLS